MTSPLSIRKMLFKYSYLFIYGKELEFTLFKHSLEIPLLSEKGSKILREKRIDLSNIVTRIKETPYYTRTQIKSLLEPNENKINLTTKIFGGLELLQISEISKFSTHLNSFVLSSDGSVREGKINSSIAWSMDLTIAFPSRFAKSIFEAEIEPIFWALMNAKNEEINVTWIGDNLSVIRTLNNLDEMNDSQILKMNGGFMILYIKKLKLKFKSLKFIHVPSHLLDSKKEKLQDHMAYLIKNFGIEWKEVLTPHQKADLAFSNPSTFKAPIISPYFGPLKIPILLLNNKLLATSKRSTLYSLLKQESNGRNEIIARPLSKHLNEKWFKKVYKIAQKYQIDKFIFKLANKKNFSFVEKIAEEDALSRWKDTNSALLGVPSPYCEICDNLLSDIHFLKCSDNFFIINEIKTFLKEIFPNEISIFDKPWWSFLDNPSGDEIDTIKGALGAIPNRMIKIIENDWKSDYATNIVTEFLIRVI